MAERVDDAGMRPVSVVPQQVPVAVVRRLDAAAEQPAPVQQVDVSLVPPPVVVPRQVDPARDPDVSRR